MKRILSVACVTLSFVAMTALNSCILDPEKTPEKKPGGGGNQIFKSLEKRDNLLDNLELAYNSRNIDEYANVLDKDLFTFFFSPNDVNEGNVQVSQWGRAEEIGATRNMFNPGFSPPNGEPISSIDLQITFSPGDDNWIIIPGTPENGHDGVDWYEKTVTYLLTVKAGDTTFTSGTPINASFLVRPIDDGNGTEIFQIVEWRDDI